MLIETSQDAAHEHKLTTLTATSAIDDVFASDDTTAPISGGIFTVTAGAESDNLKYSYGYNELKIILEGTIVLEDADTGNKIVGTAGDVIKIDKGTTVIFSSPDQGRAFYVGQRKLRDF
ncbi:hypothetical protein Rhopal_002954-T1 [Rhodotorula paludigena]|uniref:Ethanolamine utilization protein EutQ n=1 Tax=Rhodotorula paludigena TaxID=86838 RepID=A0AAV5GJE4_9BASI|nr:hypothetical protein Rhopal_002954-T1 [Rhodotorula paludigena]